MKKYISISGPKKSNVNFKGRKVNEFHINFIKGKLKDIFDKEKNINIGEVISELQRECEKNGQPIIKDRSTIHRIVYYLLENDEQKMKEYKQVVKQNSGRRNAFRGVIEEWEVGEYSKSKKKLEDLIIDEYLPKILSGEVTFDSIEKDLHTSHHTVNKIIEDYYINNDNMEGLEGYRKAKSKHKCSYEDRKKAKEMRDEVKHQDRVVSNKMFLLLTPEEQMKQVIMKIRLEKLKEEYSRNNTALLKEETTIARVEKITEYFRYKVNLQGKRVFSDEEIRYMIFRYPTIISRAYETLDFKIENLTSYEELDEETVFGMIKDFPGILGYSEERIKKQIDLLKKENLMDYVIDKPSCLMRSVNLLYALIEYAKEKAKEKNGTEDLSKVKRSSIFMANSTLKRLSHNEVSYEILLERFKYEDKEAEENDSIYEITGEQIGTATHDMADKFQEANLVLDDAINKLNKRGEKE